MTGPNRRLASNDHLVDLMEAYGYAIADGDFYAPLSDTSEAGRTFAPSSIPAGWTARSHDVWTVWNAPDVVMPDEGWKVHVSTRVDRAQHVLDTVAEACFSERVSFKHIRTELFFLALHHKHGPRQQAGKFCAAYPVDEAAAARLMDRLAEALRTEEGPYILTDRRYRDSRTVHYRWGAFTSRGRRRPDGTLAFLVRDGFGRDVFDVRGPAFVLPDGIVDPFAPEDTAVHQGTIVLGGSYEILRAIRHSNAGGTYEARDVRTGRAVFVKEARAHTGLGWDRGTAHERLRREHEVLMRIHAAAPDTCPEPLDYFREWEHEFLVTEFVPGSPLNRWIATRSPLLGATRAPADFAAYYGKCEHILEDLEAVLARLHAAGYRFGDLSPTNILIEEDARVRLVDFEAASHRDLPPIPLGTDGYTPPAGQMGTSPFAQDEYGAAAVALALLMPLHSVLQRRPSNLRLLRRDLEERAPVPESLWRRASRYGLGSKTHGEQSLPSPDELDSRPQESLEWLLREVRRGILAMAGANDRPPLFPTVPRGFETNTTCLAYGTAGVLHALRRTGSRIPDDLVARFRRDAVKGYAELPPGLHVGSAGVAWVLADLGFVDEAIELLDHASRHPIVRESTTLGEGLGGVALAQLALHRHTGDLRFLERAAAAGESILAMSDVAATLGENDAVGLLNGRAGLALFLYFLAAETGDERYLNGGTGLLHRELDRSLLLPDGALSFGDDATAWRAMPYLYAGSAGVALVLTRYAALGATERFEVTLPLVLDDVRKRCTVQAGLYCGLAGLAFALAEHASYTGNAADHDAAIAVATGLTKYAVPHPSGVRFVGEGLMRYSAELWSGSAGILLALDRVLHGAADHFFTLDAPLPQLARAA